MTIADTRERSEGTRARFTRKQPDEHEAHEERGRGWRARWREGAEVLSLERLPLRGAKRREPVPRD